MAQIVTFDGPNKLIIEISVAGDNELDVVEIYSEWKFWLTQSDNMKYFQAFTPVGGDEITTTQNLGITYFLENGWRIRPAELAHKLTLVGNLYTRESGQSAFVDTVGAFTVNTETRVSSLVDSSVSRLDLTQLLQGVYIDTIDGVAGTDEGIGTPTNPVSNITDAYTIAVRDNLRKYFLRGTITLDRDYSQWTFEGIAAEHSAFVVLGSQNVDQAKFTNVHLTGSGLSGSIEAFACHISVLTAIAGTFRSCGLESSFSVQTGGSVVFADCFSEVAGSGTPICNANGASGISFRNYSGGIEFINIIDGTLVSVDLDPGELTLGATNTGGFVLVRGTGKFYNAANGTVVDINGLVDPTATEFPLSAADKTDLVGQVFARVIENGETFEEALRIIRAEAAGTIVKTGTEHRIKSADGLTDRIIANADEDGRDVTAVDGS